MQQSNATSLSRITSVFRGGMSRYAVYGFVIAVFAVLMATVAAVMLSGEPLTLANLYAAQVGNPMLLALDLMPFVFALWGQGVAVVFTDDSARARSKNPDGEHNEKLALQAEARHNQRGEEKKK